MKPKTINRNQRVGLAVGTAVRMSDGWIGKIESISSGFVTCLADGARPCIHLCSDYRLVALSSIRLEGDKAMVAWKSPERRRSAPPPRGDLDAAVVARERLKREWDSAPA